MEENVRSVDTRTHKRTHTHIQQGTYPLHWYELVLKSCSLLTKCSKARWSVFADLMSTLRSKNDSNVLELCLHRMHWIWDRRYPPNT